MELFALVEWTMTTFVNNNVYISLSIAQGMWCGEDQLNSQHRNIINFILIVQNMILQDVANGHKLYASLRNSPFDLNLRTTKS